MQHYPVNGGRSTDVCCHRLCSSAFMGSWSEVATFLHVCAHQLHGLPSAFPLVCTPRNPPPTTLHPLHSTHAQHTQATHSTAALLFNPLQWYLPT
jgi:hypothetical protein